MPRPELLTSTQRDEGTTSSSDGQRFQAGGRGEEAGAIDDVGMPRGLITQTSEDPWDGNPWLYKQLVICGVGLSFGPLTNIESSPCPPKVLSGRGDHTAFVVRLSAWPAIR